MTETTLEPIMPAMSHPTHVNGHTPPHPVVQAIPLPPNHPAHPAPKPAKPQRRLPGLHDEKALGGLFYTSILTFALAGGAQAAEGWLGWWMPFNVAVVAVFELGGVYLASMADSRRKKGERAIAARIGSAVIAAGATALNLFGHAAHPIQAGVFATFSAGGYGVWLIRSGQRRRDQLRADGKLAVPLPVYGLRLELRERRLVTRAKALATDDPTLGRAGSLAQARRELKDEDRRAAMTKVVKADLTAALGVDNANLLIDALDPDDLMDEIRRRADLAGVADIYGRRIDPARIEAASATIRRRGQRTSQVTQGGRWWRRSVTPTVAVPPPAARPEQRALPAADDRRRVNAKTTAPKGPRSAEQNLALYDEHLRNGRNKTEAAALVGVSPQRMRAIVAQLRPNQPTDAGES